MIQTISKSHLNLVYIIQSFQVVTWIKVMDDEKPDVQEVYEQVSEFQFALEFYLEDGALDGFSAEEAQGEIRQHMQYPFYHLNPFDYPNIRREVDIYTTEVCENEETHEVDETGNACEPTALQNGGLLSGQWIGRKTEKTVARVSFRFESWLNFLGPLGEMVVVETVQWTSKKTQILEKNLLESVVHLLTPEAESCWERVWEENEILSKMTLKEQGIVVTLIFADRSSFKLHNWMAHLSPKMRKVPFTMLAIPGSHHSASHKMRKDQVRSYDSLSNVDLLPDVVSNTQFESLFSFETLALWGRCVEHNIKEQLEMGIRYFDFRFEVTICLSFHLSFQTHEKQKLPIRSLERP